MAHRKDYLNQYQYLFPDYNLLWQELISRYIFFLLNLVTRIVLRAKFGIHGKLYLLLITIFSALIMLNIKQIKIQSNLIVDLQIPYPLFLRKLMSQIIETFPTKDIFTIIQMITEYELLLKKSYRDIIYLESLLIQLYKNIHD